MRVNIVSFTIYSVNIIGESSKNLTVLQNLHKKISAFDIPKAETGYVNYSVSSTILVSGSAAFLRMLSMPFLQPDLAL